VAENYVHRIGRTARAGASGRAIAFCSPEETSELRAIQKVLGTELAVAGGTPWEGMQPRKNPVRAKKSRRPRNRGGKQMKRAA
jgi:ATP-dependent RNA helicase RhlE